MEKGIGKYSNYKINKLLIQKKEYESIVPIFLQLDIYKVKVRVINNIYYQFRYLRNNEKKGVILIKLLMYGYKIELFFKIKN